MMIELPMDNPKLFRRGLATRSRVSTEVRMSQSRRRAFGP